MVSSMEFNCKLAHCNEVRKVSRFNSIKDLYERISQTFEISPQDILYCTLNTHNYSDMESLLGNHLSVKDLIVVHLCGTERTFTFTKNEEYLGLTITDNGYGKAFVKKVKSKDGSIEGLIRAGDHIAAINSESTVGMRHYEVAKAIRDVPQRTNFKMVLVEPLQSGSVDDKRDPDNSLREQELTQNRLGLNGDLELSNQSSSRLDSSKHSEVDGLTEESASYLDELVNSSLPISKLLSKSQQQTGLNQQMLPNETFSEGQDSYSKTISRINGVLESFLGINDSVLAVRIYRLAKENKNSFDCFRSSIRTSELRAFNFGDEIESHLWNCVEDQPATDIG